MKGTERFELVARGMDIRVKCERMRAAIGINRKIGPNMEARLKAFEKTLIKMRNKMLHSWAVLDTEKKSIIHLASMSKMPTSRIKPPQVSSNELAFLSYWLFKFNSDLLDAQLNLHGSKYSKQIVPVASATGRAAEGSSSNDFRHSR